MGIVLNNIENIRGLPYSLPTASSSELGGVKIGSGINISGGVISVGEVQLNEIFYRQSLSDTEGCRVKYNKSKKALQFVFEG